MELLLLFLTCHFLLWFFCLALRFQSWSEKTYFLQELFLAFGNWWFPHLVCPVPSAPCPWTVTHYSDNKVSCCVCRELSVINTLSKASNPYTADTQGSAISDLNRLFLNVGESYFSLLHAVSTYVTYVSFDVICNSCSQVTESGLMLTL